MRRLTPKSKGLNIYLQSYSPATEWAVPFILTLTLVIIVRSHDERTGESLRGHRPVARRPPSALFLRKLNFPLIFEKRKEKTSEIEISFHLCSIKYFLKILKTCQDLKVV